MDKLLEILRSVGINFEALPSVSSVGPGMLFGSLGAVALSIFGISLGRTKAVISLLSLYVAFAFVGLFPYFDTLESAANLPVDKYWIRMGFFIISYAITFIIFNLSFLRKRLSSVDFNLISILILSVLQLGLAVSIIASFLPEEIARKLFSDFYIYFASSKALFFWAISPLPVLPFLKGK